MIREARAEQRDSPSAFAEGLTLWLHGGATSEHAEIAAEVAAINLAELLILWRKNNTKT